MIEAASASNNLRVRTSRLIPAANPRNETHLSHFLRLVSVPTNVTSCVHDTDSTRAADSNYALFIIWLFDSQLSTRRHENEKNVGEVTL